MRIAFVASDLGPASGGVGAMAVDLARALGEVGVEVALHCVGAVPERAAGLDVRSHAPAWPSRLARSPFLQRALADQEADVVHAHGLWQLPLGYAAAAALQQGVPLVISPHGMLASWALARSRGAKLLARVFLHPRALRRAAGYHAASGQEAGDIRAFAASAPICEAPFGVRLQSAAEREAAGVELRARLPELEGRRVLLFYSRFHPVKGIVELLDSFVGLSRARPSWHLLAIGQPEEYSVEQLETRVAQLGLRGRVTVIDGTRLPAPYPVADLFVLPSRHESFGAVVAEALVSGVPVVTTTGTPWAPLEQAGVGRCVDVSELRSVLGAMMSQSSQELAAMGARGREWVLSQRSWRDTATALLGFYEQLGAFERGDPGSGSRATVATSGR